MIWERLFGKDTPGICQVSRKVAENNKAMLEKALVGAGFDLNAPMQVTPVGKHMVEYRQHVRSIQEDREGSPEDDTPRPGDKQGGRRR